MRKKGIIKMGNNVPMGARNELFSAMSAGVPYKSYIKTILAKVFITYWDVYENTATGGILEGDPRKKEEGTFIDLYSEQEDHFFKRSNKKHFESGILIPFDVQNKEVKETGIEGYSDDEIIKLVNSKFFALQSALNNTDSEAVVYRMLATAKELEKSQKLIMAIESRLSEIQEGNNPRASNMIEEEL